jgi:hypothetical protein
MATTRITCPDCKSVLKPARPVPDGKKVKCPKCGNLFTTPGLVEDDDEHPRKKAPRKEKAGIKKAARPEPPPPPKRHDDDDEDGGGIYSYIPEPGDEEENKPDINYAPDMSIKDLRGPAQAAVVKPSNYLLLIGGLSCLCNIFLICFAFWPMVFSDSVIDYEKVLEKHYREKGTKDAAEKIKSIPKERKEITDKEDLAFLEEAEDEERIVRFIAIGVYILLLIYNGIAVIGAVKLQNLESRGWGIASAIMTMLPMGSAGIGSVFYLLVAKVGGLLLDELAVPYAMGLAGLVWVVAIVAGIAALRTLFSQEVIDGFEYVAD